MPESIFDVAQLVTPDDVAAVMFELQDLPCVNQGASQKTEFKVR